MRWVRGPLLRSWTGGLDTAINVAGWAHPDITPSKDVDCLWQPTTGPDPPGRWL